jgi:hypothetical protein
MNKANIDIKLFRYNPFDPNTVTLLEEEYDEFKFDFGVKKEQAVRYLILFYDLNTPLRIRYPELISRKNECAKLSDFKTKPDGSFQKAYEDLMVGENEVFNNAVSAYIRSFGSPEYISLNMYWNIFASEYKNAAKITSSKDYKDTIANIKQLQNEITKLTDALFGGHEIINMRTSLYKGIEKERVKLRPEDIAKMLDDQKKIKEVLGDQYEGYIPEPLEFLGDK